MNRISISNFTSSVTQLTRSNYSFGSAYNMKVWKSDTYCLVAKHYFGVHVFLHRAFLMSSDVWLEPDMWADYGHLDEAEKNESHVLKNDLFVISPKKGCLESNSHVSITMTYK